MGIFKGSWTKDPGASGSFMFSVGYELLMLVSRIARVRKLMDALRDPIFPF